MPEAPARRKLSPEPCRITDVRSSLEPGHSGKGSVQEVFPLPDGSALMLTVARYYTPKGRAIQAEGIAPDIKVELTEPAGQEETEMNIREKDLEGHIKGDADHSTVKESIQAKEDLDAMKDNQLRSAIELLASWEAMGHIKTK